MHARGLCPKQKMQIEIYQRLRWWWENVSRKDRDVVCRLTSEAKHRRREGEVTQAPHEGQGLSGGWRARQLSRYLV